MVSNVYKRIVSLALCAIMLCGMFVSCSKPAPSSEDPQSAPVSDPAQESEQLSEASESSAEEESSAAIQESSEPGQPEESSEPVSEEISEESDEEPSAESVEESGEPVSEISADEQSEEPSADTSAATSGDESKEEFSKEESKEEPSKEESKEEPSKEEPSKEESKEEPSKEESKEEPSEEPSEESSEESSEEIETGPICISIGKSYTSDVAPSDTYPDSYGIQLTDGVISPRSDVTYSDPNYAGYLVNSGVTEVNITVDLGAVTSDVFRFEADCMRNSSAGVVQPSSVTVEYSSDKKTWKSAGTLNKPDFSENSANTYVLELSKGVECRYVRFHFSRGGAWLFVDELSIYGIGVIEKEASAEEVIRGLYNDESFTESSLKKALDSVKTGTPDKTQTRFNIISDKSYTVDAKPVSMFPDKGKMLTNGEKGAGIDGNTWVGYSGGKDISITVPLGSKVTDIAAFELHAYSSGKGNMVFPRGVIFSVSADGSNWKQLARCYAPTGDQNDYTFTAELPYTVSAKYVRFTMQTDGSKMVLIDEVSVFAYNDSRADSNSVYPTPHFPEITENSYWPSGSTDYNTNADLIKGLPTQIHFFDPESADKNNNTPASSPILTDGVYATDLDFHGGRYFKFYGNGKRYVFYDLQHVSTLKEFKAGLIQRTSWAIYAPASVPVLVSADAVHWYTAGEIKLDNTKDQVKLTGTLKLGTPVAARFVCFVIDVSTWGGCDELEAIGTKAVESSTPLPEKSGLPAFNGVEWTTPSSSVSWGEYNDVLGAKDIYLAYHGKTRHPSADDLLPIIGHIGTDGKYDDTMFDGALFLMSGGFPSNLGGGTGGVLRYNKSDIEWLLAQLFDQTQNIPALESAAGTLKKALGLAKSYKVKYYVSLYYPDCDDFGDIDGDGKSEDLSTAAGKIQVLSWFIDRFEAERAKHNFENIEFGGYYWYNESMKAGDETISNAIADKIHSLNSVMFWIPYFNARGNTEWRKYGFDLACLQPNFAFSTEVDETRIPAAARIASSKGMCIEIEMDHRVASDTRYRQRYYEYLKQGFKQGYQAACQHLYYIGASLQSFGKASDPDLRQIYDYTYRFIKGTLVLKPKKPSEAKVSCKAGTPCEGDAGANITAKATFKVVKWPDHGTLTLESDGSYTYYPNKGYTGKDTFSVAYTEGLDYSDPATVTVTVK